jgi:hypothetical protein
MKSNFKAALILTAALLIGALSFAQAKTNYSSTTSINGNKMEQALQAEHHVTAVVRNPDTFNIRHKFLEIIKVMCFNLKHLKM